MDPESIEDLFSSFGPVRIKRMFGGLGIFADGLMFALILDDVLHFKADEALAVEFAALGCRPFTYERAGRVVNLGYWSVPEVALDDPEALAGWARRAFTVARAAATLSPRRTIRKRG